MHAEREGAFRARARQHLDRTGTPMLRTAFAPSWNLASCPRVSLGPDGLTVTEPGGQPRLLRSDTWKAHSLHERRFVVDDALSRNALVSCARQTHIGFARAMNLQQALAYNTAYVTLTESLHQRYWAPDAGWTLPTWERVFGGRAQALAALTDPVTNTGITAVQHEKWSVIERSNDYARAVQQAVSTPVTAAGAFRTATTVADLTSLIYQVDELRREEFVATGDVVTSSAITAGPGGYSLAISEPSKLRPGTVMASFEDGNCVQVTLTKVAFESSRLTAHVAVPKFRSAGVGKDSELAHHLLTEHDRCWLAADAFGSTKNLDDVSKWSSQMLQRVPAVPMPADIQAATGAV